MGTLILVRHGESEWNKLGKWTGWTDIDLDDTGIKQAHDAARALEGVTIDIAFTSPLIRAKHTLLIILEDLGQSSIEIKESDAIKEKNYGDFTGKNKWEVKTMVGDAEFLTIRRSWNYRLPNGESLEDVYLRAVAFYTSSILPLLQSGKTVILAGHGNTNRALVKYLEKISDEDVATLEIATGEVYLYTVDESGEVKGKEIRASHPNLV